MPETILQAVGIRKEFGGLQIEQARRLKELEKENAQLRRAVAEAGLGSCEVFGDGMSVRVEDSDFEPDAVLRCGHLLPGHALAVPDPLVLVEVLRRGLAADPLARRGPNGGSLV